MLVYEQHLHFPFNIYLYTISALEEHGNTYNPVFIYACRAYKQTVTCTYLQHIVCIMKMNNDI
jgi:hypothetical protein